MAFLNTIKYALRYPNLAQAADLADIVQKLAEDVDAAMVGFGINTHALRPAAGKAGRFYYETDTSILFLDDGATWIQQSPPTIAHVEIAGTIAVSGTIDIISTAAITWNGTTKIELEYFTPMINIGSAGPVDVHLRDTNGNWLGILGGVDAQEPYYFKRVFTPPAGTRGYKLTGVTQFGGSGTDFCGGNAVGDPGTWENANQNGPITHLVPQFLKLSRV